VIAAWQAVGGHTLATETPVALVFDGTTQAVMMASPCDIEDFLRGFARTEGLIETQTDITRIEIVAQANGIEARAWLRAPMGNRLKARRRAMLGPVGCGLCGIDSLNEALRPVSPVAQTLCLSPRDPARAMESLRAKQPLQDATRAAHAAALWTLDRGLIAIREDIGRHNALDKLAGAIEAAGGVAEGVIVLTSRLSVDLIQKAAMMGGQILIAAGAPTTLAQDTATRAGITLIGRIRDDSYQIYTHPDRIREAL
jgi:FdhD protein